MSASVAKLRPQDHIVYDPGPIARIYREMGPEAAEPCVTRAIGELALCVASAAKCINQRDVSELPQNLKRMRFLADKLGMSTVSQTAGDVQDCLDDFDATAFAAIWARLLRVTGSQLALTPKAQNRRG